ncbi:MAG: hypothetical protein CSA95_01490 [Bacteroidetes bacterium]|nr:MAG: hypothetical protein CSA95_01490 [Bacteroidota bacterium]
MKRIKNQQLFFIVIVVLMLLPLAQQVTGFPRIAKLKGYFVEAKKPQLKVQHVWDGSYQDSLNSYIEDHIGFRPLLVRLHNTVDYYLYHKINANNVILGKDDYAFEEGYIHATLGRDFIGEDTISAITAKARVIQDCLQEKGIIFLVVFAPGKATFFPDRIPDAYHPDSVTTTNLEVYRKKMLDKKVNLVDFNKWFVEMKDTSSYPLYPQYGIHWSHYGMLLALDSLTHYLEAGRAIDMPEMSWSEVEVSKRLRHTDYDLGEALNLLWQLPTYGAAYPRVVFEKEEGKEKPSLLAASDSFFWNWYGTGFTDRFFSRTDFLYYFNQYYSSSFSGSKSISELSLLPFVEAHDVVMVMATDGNLKTFAFGFIDKLYEAIIKIESKPLSFTWSDPRYTTAVAPGEFSIRKGTPWQTTFLRCDTLNLKSNTSYRLLYEAKGYKFLQMDLYPYEVVPRHVNTNVSGDTYQTFRWDFKTDQNPGAAQLRVYIDYATSFGEESFIRNVRLQELP